MRQSFSDRIGVTKPNDVIQLNNITRELRNLLWNSFDIYYLSSAKNRSVEFSVKDSYLRKLFTNLWMYHFKNTLDNLPYGEKEFIYIIRDYFMTKEWYKVYNFLDFCLEYADDTGIDKKGYINFTNDLLKQELSGYRIINDYFVPISNEEQINSINETLRISKEKGLNGVYSHISAALELISSREISSSDKYRNTIKESISSVEALCNKLNNKKSDGLKGALKLLKDKVNIHGALEQGFIKLYGYTSDSDGIRHTIMDEPNLDLEDAIYMLVTCSGFVNYLIEKAVKAGLIN